MWNIITVVASSHIIDKVGNRKLCARFSLFNIIYMEAPNKIVNMPELET